MPTPDTRLVELLAREHIKETVYRFGMALDHKNFHHYPDIYADEIDVDYTDSLGMKQRIGLREWQAAAAAFFGQLDATQHLIFPRTIEFNEALDQATVNVLMLAQHYQPNENGAPSQRQYGEYVMEVRRIDQQWKIARILQKIYWQEGNYWIVDPNKEK